MNWKNIQVGLVIGALIGASIGAFSAYYIISVNYPNDVLKRIEALESEVNAAYEEINSIEDGFSQLISSFEETEDTLTRLAERVDSFEENILAIDEIYSENLTQQLELTVSTLHMNETGAAAFVGFNDVSSSKDNYFLCDGNADDVQIQQAIDWVGSTFGGGTVHIEACPKRVEHYDIAASISSGGYDHITIEGEGSDTTLRLAGGVNSGIFSIFNSEGWVIRDLRLDGNKDAQTSDFSVLLLWRCNYSSVFNVEAFGGSRKISERGEGIELFNCMWCTVSHCVCHDNDYDGIKLMSNTWYCAISNNILYNNTSGGIQCAYGSNYNTISGNIVYYKSVPESRGRGFTAHYSSHNTIGDNVFYYCRDGLDIFEGSSYNTICSNEIHGGSGTSRSKTGIFIRGDNANCTNNIVGNNNIYDTNQGILLDSNYCHYNTISGNGVFESKWAGIRVKNNNCYNMITNNIIHGEKDFGIEVYSGALGTFINSNYITNMLQYGIRIQAGALDTIIGLNPMGEIGIAPILDDGINTRI